MENIVFNFASPENFNFFLQFIVPGFIILYFRSQFITGKFPTLSESLVAFLSLSTLYQAILYPFRGILPANGPESWLVWVLITFFVPSVLGIILGIISQRDWIRNMIRKLGANPVHQVPTAWDWYFSRSVECWVLITLKNGIEWRG